MNFLPMLVREALLKNALPHTLPALDDHLRLRLYRAAVELVPPSPTAYRSPGEKPGADEKLLEDFLKGNAEAFEDLMERHLPWMQGWAQKQLPYDDAADAVQEAFITLLKKAPSFQVHSSLKGYLSGLLRISVLRALRAQARRRSEPLEDEHLDALEKAPHSPEVTMLTSTPPSPDEALLTRYPHAQLAKALDHECTLREQEVILLTLEGQSDATIAAALEISDNYVRVLRHRAITKLRKALATSSD